MAPNEASLYAHDWKKTRELLKKAADRDLLRLEILSPLGARNIAGATQALNQSITYAKARVDQVNAALARVRKSNGTNTVAARRHIGDAAVAAARYPF